MPELGFHLASCPECHALWFRAAAAPDDHPATPGDEPAAPAPAAIAAPYEPAFIAAWIDEQHMPIPEAVGATDADITQPADPQPDHVSYGTLLRNPNFRLLWLGEAVSTFGSYFTRVAIPIYVYKLTGDEMQLGFAAFSSLIVPLLFGLFAGALVDRWDRRRTMIWADIASAALLALLIAVIALPHNLPLPLVLGSIYGVNFLAALLRELFNPARMALFADVLQEHELLAANALDRATTTLGELLSYPLAGAALFFLGPTLAFGIDALSFLLSAALLWGIRARTAAPAREEQAGIWREIGEGLVMTMRLPLVREIVLLSLIVPLLMSLMNVMQLPYVVHVLGSREEIGFPAMEGAMALGVVLGMLALGRWGQKLPRGPLLAYGMSSMGLAMFLQGQIPVLDQAFGLGQHLANGIATVAGMFGLTLTGAWYGAWTPLLMIALPLMVVAGATNSLILTSIRTVLQERTPRNLMGRVASVFGMTAGLGFALGALLAGLGQDNPQLVYTITGGLLCAIGIVSWWWLPRGSNTAVSVAPAS